ncbi:MAG: type II toxin-antitoxin system RelE/ParE family toxin [Asticcacaulis sp.]|uniref:type II toxin-antitoxin system RelE/ParE family toxin n=1 Tax=Asticcacaulis sp. TaxID=1872648 RepID=UPI0039E276CC
MRRVVWSTEARSDLTEIVAFIAEDNPSAARRVVDSLDETGIGLGRMATGRQGRVVGTYEKVVSGLPYILAYALKAEADGAETVYILRVIHTSRNWPEQEWPAG